MVVCETIAEEAVEQMTIGSRAAPVPAYWHLKTCLEQIKDPK